MYVTLDTVGEKINVLECFNRAVENTQLKHRKENGKYSQKKKKIDIEYVTKKVSQYPVKFLIYVEFKYVTKMFKVLSRRVSVLHSWHYLGINKSIIYFAVLKKKKKRILVLITAWRPCFHSGNISTQPRTILFFFF